MYISKINIENFKCFEGKFSLAFNEHINILVGDNEVGKSTIIEAIDLALTGLLEGRYIKTELNQFLFNIHVIDDYKRRLKSSSEDPPIPPRILIEIFFDGISDDAIRALFEGNGNSDKKKACGIKFEISLSDVYKPYYEELIKSNDIQSLPIEYYDFHWSSFARDESITPGIIPIKSALIDSSSTKYKNGSDVYISRILKDHIEKNDEIAVSQAHRRFREVFDEDDSIIEINKKIKDVIDISDREIKLSVDVSSKNAWETTLTTYLNKVPFQYVGKGEQTLIKIKLALGHKKTKEANILLVEEPENHLSHTKLNKLIKYLRDKNTDKQVIISTHSSFVANELDLGNLILLNILPNSNSRESMSFRDLPEDTRDYFEKLSGYETLRLVLCKSAILVEGDSDDLIVKKAYMVNHGNTLPIQEEREIIIVGTAFLRFLAIASKLTKKVVVITDNDGDIDSVKNKYRDYLGSNEKENIRICFDNDEDMGDLKIGKQKRPFNYNTLEPKLVKANDLNIMKKIFNKEFLSIDEVHKYMYLNKTDCALAIFRTGESINFPSYILEAIDFITSEK